MLETLEREKNTSFPYEEYRPQLLTGVRAELDQLMCSLTTGLEVLRRQLLQDGKLTRESSQDRLENLTFIVQQMNWLCGDLMDLAGWEERESQNVVADVSRQMEMFASVAQQQMEDIHWKGTVRYNQESTLYASVNCGYLYSACANILANLCYYGGQGDLHLNVTQDRAVELSVEERSSLRWWKKFCRAAIRNRRPGRKTQWESADFSLSAFTVRPWVGSLNWKNGRMQAGYGSSRRLSR